jgi:hypothetical protein
MEIHPLMAHNNNLPNPRMVRSLSNLAPKASSHHLLKRKTSQLMELNSHQNLRMVNPNLNLQHRRQATLPSRLPTRVNFLHLQKMIRKHLLQMAPKNHLSPRKVNSCLRPHPRRKI